MDRFHRLMGLGGWNMRYRWMLLHPVYLKHAFKMRVVSANITLCILAEIRHTFLSLLRVAMKKNQCNWRGAFLLCQYVRWSFLWKQTILTIWKLCSVSYLLRQCRLFKPWGLKHIRLRTLIYCINYISNYNNKYSFI